MIRRPVRGMRGRAHAGMSGYPANLRRVAGRRDDHLPGVKSSGGRSAVLLWSPDSGSADGRLLFGETPTGVVTAENRGTYEGLVSAYATRPSARIVHRMRGRPSRIAVVRSSGGSMWLWP